MTMPADTHSKFIGYILWIFGFLGSHRFNYGRPVSGTVYFFTFGVFFIGWIIDLFLIPGMDREANWRFVAGAKDYNVTSIYTFLGVYGVHRFYMGKGFPVCSRPGVFLIGVIYDFWTLNQQVSEINTMEKQRP